MKYILFVFWSLLICVSLLTTCTNSQEENKSISKEKETTDSLYDAEKLYLSLSAQIKAIKYDYSSSKVVNASFKKEIDDLQNDVIQYQTNTFKLKSVEKKLNVFIKDKSELIKQIAILGKQNNDLIDSTNNMADRLKTTSDNLKQVITENNKLKQSFKLANVKVKSYGHSHGLFRKTKMVETNVAKEVVFIEVTFVVIANNTTVSNSYVLNIIIKGATGRIAKKDLKIFYNGTEQSYALKFDDNYDFQTGTHLVDIICRGEKLYSGNLKLD